MLESEVGSICFWLLTAGKGGRRANTPNTGHNYLQYGSIG